MIAPLTLFMGCINPNLTKNNENNNNAKEEGGQGTQLMSTLGGALLGALTTYVGSEISGFANQETDEEKKERQEKLKDKVMVGALVGAAAGYVIGGELAKMQSNYKGQENQLISEIINIDSESKLLQTKNDALSISISKIENEITELENSKSLKKANKINLVNKLNEKKRKFHTLLKKNQILSSKISNSKSKVNKYKYKAVDKKEILKDVALLDNQTKKYKDDINQKIAYIDTMLSNLA